MLRDSSVGLLQAGAIEQKELACCCTNEFKPYEAVKKKSVQTWAKPYLVSILG